MNSFETSEVWQASKVLTIKTYSKTKECRDYSFVDQMRRASVSIMNNVAEGFERQTLKEHVQFLYVSKGSCGELRSMLYLARDFGYLSETDFSGIHDDCLVLSKRICGLIKYLRTLRTK